LANPSVPLRLADEKSRNYWVWNFGKTMLVKKLFFYKRFAHNLPIFLIGLNSGICQTLRNIGMNFLLLWEYIRFLKSCFYPVFGRWPIYFYFYFPATLAGKNCNNLTRVHDLLLIKNK
jgi:hypothetical protein